MERWAIPTFAVHGPIRCLEAAYGTDYALALEVGSICNGSDVAVLRCIVYRTP